MENTATALARVNAFARAMKPDVPPVDVALADLREMLGRAGVAYVLVGGVAVIHHGYVRATDDIDVLLDREAVAGVEPLLADGGFERRTERRWHHLGSRVDVDLLLAGEPMPRGRDRYPHPAEVGRSPREADVVDLTGLIALKLQAGRYQDLADIVRLLQALDESDYLNVEAGLPPDLRQRVFELREDALEERRWRDRDDGR